MREKYVEERFPRWFVFGKSETTCDLNDGEQDVFIGIPHGVAKKLEKARDAYVDALCEIFMDAPDALYKYATHLEDRGGL